MAPLKAAVLPLSKKLAEPARKIAADLRRHWNVFYDDAGNIGRRYRRQDEAGTPFCVTYDFDSEDDQKVTVRDRDDDEPGARRPSTGSTRSCATGWRRDRATQEARRRRRRRSEGGAGKKKPAAKKRDSKGRHSQGVLLRQADARTAAPSMKDLLGGKGANLAEMTRLGVPVPPGFTISTEVCADLTAGRGLADPRRRSSKDALAALAKVERVMGMRFGDHGAPAPRVRAFGVPEVSMPGMMDTVLNLGLNDRTVGGSGRAGRRALRLRQLSPLRPDVRRRRARACPTSASRPARRAEARRAEPTSIPSSPGRGPAGW